MQIKKFLAHNMPEALKMVKKEFGSEAVILSARKVENDKGLFNLSRNYGIEVTAATDLYQKEATIQMNSRNAVNAKYNGGYESYINHDQAAKKNNFISSLKQNAKIYRKKKGIDLPVNVRNKETKELYVYFKQLLEQDVEKSIAVKIIKEIDKYAFPERYLSKKGINSCMTHVLNNLGIAASRVKLDKNKAKIVAFVGPTGVGKTSTIAKLTAAAKVRENKQNVALVTLDDNRIGAFAQLKLYAQILGSPILRASTDDDITGCIERLNKYKLIFLDTPGFGPKNTVQMRQIKNILDKVEGIEYQLVLSAESNNKSLQKSLEFFDVFDIKGLIFTKLDECVTYGQILNYLVKARKPVSYFTNGQNVPEDIEVATIRKLVELILNQKSREKYLRGSPEELARNILSFEKILYDIEDDSVAIGLNEKSKYIPLPNTISKKRISNFS